MVHRRPPPVPRASPPAACSAGAVWHPRAPGAACLVAGGSVWWGGGAVGVPPSVRGTVGGPRGARGGGSPCLSQPPCLPRARTKAGVIGIAQSMEGVAPILNRLLSACWCPDAVCGLPLRAGARLLACCGYRGCGRAADWGACGVRAQWHPSPVAGALSGGRGSPCGAGGFCWAGVPLAGLRLSLGWGGEGGGVLPGLPGVPLRSPGASLRWLRGGGLTISAPAPPSGRWLPGG